MTYCGRGRIVDKFLHKTLQKCRLGSEGLVIQQQHENDCGIDSRRIFTCCWFLLRCCVNLLNFPILLNTVLGSFPFKLPQEDLCLPQPFQSVSLLSRFYMVSESTSERSWFSQSDQNIYFGVSLYSGVTWYPLQGYLVVPRLSNLAWLSHSILELVV